MEGRCRNRRKEQDRREVGIEGRMKDNRSRNRWKKDLDNSREKRGEWSEWNNKWRKEVGIEVKNGREEKKK